MDKLLKKGINCGAKWEIHQGKNIYIIVQPTKTKKATVTDTKRGTVEETIKQVIPIREKDESESAYKGRCSYMKRLIKKAGGKTPSEFPEGWKVEEIEVTTKRKGLIETKREILKHIPDGKEIKKDIFLIPLSNQMNKLIFNILNSK
jgi:hypothetical protein